MLRAILERIFMNFGGKIRPGDRISFISMVFRFLQKLSSAKIELYFFRIISYQIPVKGVNVIELGTSSQIFSCQLLPTKIFYYYRLRGG